MSLDDRIGCAPQLVTACVALAAVIAGIIYAREQSKERPLKNPSDRTESSADSIVSIQRAFVNSGVEK